MMVVVNTPTPEDYEEVVTWATDQDKQWGSGGKNTHIKYWYYHGAETCVIIRDNEIAYCKMEYIFSNYKSINVLNMDQFRRHVVDQSIQLFGKKFDLR